MKLYKRYCENPECGKAFMGTKTQRYCCPEHRKKQEYLKKDADVKPKPKQHKNKSLTEVAVEARKLGMTYGKYVSMQYIEEQRERKDKNA